MKWRVKCVLGDGRGLISYRLNSFEGCSLIAENCFKYSQFKQFTKYTWNMYEFESSLMKCPYTWISVVVDSAPLLFSFIVDAELFKARMTLETAERRALRVLLIHESRKSFRRNLRVAHIYNGSSFRAPQQLKPKRKQMKFNAPTLLSFHNNNNSTSKRTLDSWSWEHAMSSADGKGGKWVSFWLKTWKVCMHTKTQQRKMFAPFCSRSSHWTLNRRRRIIEPAVKIALLLLG